MTKEQVFGLIRHALTVGAGILASYGYGTEELWTTVVAGIMALVAIIWSVKAPEKPKKGGSSGTLMLLLAIAFVPFWFTGCATLEKIERENPATYQAGKTFIQFALNSAKEAFLAKNPQYREGLTLVLDGLSNLPPRAAIEELERAITDDSDRQEFADELAKTITIDPEVPASGDEAGVAWVAQVSLGL